MKHPYDYRIDAAVILVFSVSITFPRNNLKQTEQVGCLYCNYSCFCSFLVARMRECRLLMSLSTSCSSRTPSVSNQTPIDLKQCGHHESHVTRMRPWCLLGQFGFSTLFCIAVMEGNHNRVHMLVTLQC